MLRWLVTPSVFRNRQGQIIADEKDAAEKNKGQQRASVLSPLAHLELLNEKKISSRYWVGATDDGFRAFLSFANLSLKNLKESDLESARLSLSTTALPKALAREIEGAGVHWQRDDILEVQVCLSPQSESVMPTPTGNLESWSLRTMTEFSVRGGDALGEAIRLGWLSLFQKVAWTTLARAGLTLQDTTVTLIVRESTAKGWRGKAYSFSPRCPWDRRHLVVSFQQEGDEVSYLVDRKSLHSSYYGKISSENDFLRSRQQFRLMDIEKLPSLDIVKKVAETLLKTEELIGAPQEIEFLASSENNEMNVLNVRGFDRALPQCMMDESLNTNNGNLWDQTLLRWNQGETLEPLWWSMLPRNFRTLSIRYLNHLGIKAKVPGSYEKVFKNFWGILRGRPYVNLAAFHRYLALGQHQHLAEELAIVLPLLTKRYDREQKAPWDQDWPSPPSYSKSDRKAIKNKQKMFFKKMATNISVWVEDARGLLDQLIHNDWQQVNAGEMLRFYESWEARFTPSCVALVMAELHYWNTVSWYYQGTQRPSLNFTWERKLKKGDDRDAITVSGSWLERRRLEKQIHEMEILEQLRPAYFAVLSDVARKLTDFFLRLGAKFQTLGQLIRPDDIFYLTLEELLAFEEGRASTISWMAIVTVRRREYDVYKKDTKIPELWFTHGMVGLAARFPRIISIRDNQIDHSDQRANSTIAVYGFSDDETSTLDFIETETAQSGLTAQLNLKDEDEPNPPLKNFEPPSFSP